MKYCISICSLYKSLLGRYSTFLFSYCLWNPVCNYTGSTSQFRWATFQMLNSHCVGKHRSRLFFYFSPFPHSVPCFAFADPSLQRYGKGWLYPPPLLILTQLSPSQEAFCVRSTRSSRPFSPYRVSIPFHIFSLYLSLSSNYRIYYTAYLVYCPLFVNFVLFLLLCPQVCITTVPGR